MIQHTLFPSGSTGTGRKMIAGTEDVEKAYVIFTVEAVGATPTITFNLNVSHDGVTFQQAAHLADDASSNTSSAAVTTTTTGVTILFLDGLDKRFYENIGINVSANTNVTFNAKLVTRP